MARETFISHRHGDSAIAEVIRTHLQLWNIPEDEIFQSSHAHSGVRIGDNLNDSLSSQLKKSKLVILIYTFADLDWSYCMWECGVATDPEENKTHIIVLQCTTDRPKLFRSQGIIRANTQDDISRFVFQAHKDPECWPDAGCLNEQIGEEILKRRSVDLLNDLAQVIPEGRFQEFDRWDSFKLSLSKENIEELKQFKLEEHKEEIASLVKERCIVADEFGLAPRHFGYERLPQHITLGEMYEQWNGVCEEKGDCPEGWLEALCEDVWTAAKDQPARPSWQLLHSAMPDTDFWFHIVLSQKAILPDNAMCFTIYMHRIPTSMARQRASVDMKAESVPAQLRAVGR
jgi:hypothetical protein